MARYRCAQQTDPQTVSADRQIGRIGPGRFGIGNHQNWMGAVYYRILMNKVRGRKIYTLIGFMTITAAAVKIIEILEFDE